MASTRHQPAYQNKTKTQVKPNPKPESSGKGSSSGVIQPVYGTTTIGGPTQNQNQTDPKVGFGNQNQFWFCVSAKPTPTQTETIAEVLGLGDVGWPLFPNNTIGAATKVQHLIATPSQSWCVRPSPNFLVVDFDYPNPGLDTWLVQLIEEAHHNPDVFVLVQQSGRLGGRHLWWFGPPTRRTQIATTAKNFGGDIRQGWSMIRLPGVSHRDNLPVVLVSHPDWDTVCAELRNVQNRTKPPQGISKAGLVGDHRLSSKLWRLIRFGDRHGRYYHRGTRRVDGSALVMAIANIAVNEQVPSQKLWYLLLDPNNLGGASLQRRLAHYGERSARRWFERTWAKAQQPPTGQWETRQDAQFAVQAWIETVSGWVPGGRRGSTDVVVAAAIGRLASRFNQTQLPLSVRVLAEEANLAVGTIRRSLKTLVEVGWLSTVQKPWGEQATRYELLIPLQAVTRVSDTGLFPAGGCGSVSSSRTKGLASDKTIRLNHDVWTPGGFGKTALRVFAAVRGAPHRTKELAAGLQTHPATIRRALSRLEAGGLVECRDGVWVLSSLEHETTFDTVLDEVATQRGVAGRNLRRRHNHLAQRFSWKNWLFWKHQRFVEQQLGPTMVAGYTQESWEPLPLPEHIPDLILSS